MTTAIAERLEMRDKIQRLIAAMEHMFPNGTKTAKDYPLKHSFLGGTYVRQIFMPAHHIVVGKIHRFPNITMINSGMAVVVSENSPKPRVFKAGDQLEIPAFNANVLFTMTDVYWTTVHPNIEATTVEDAELEIQIPDFKQLAVESGIDDSLLVGGD